MNQLLIFLSVLTLFSCSKGIDDVETLVPACIQDLVQDTSVQNTQHIKTIRVQKVHEQLAYWLNTDARHSDGAEYIVNANCDTLCYITPILPACAQNYDEDKWLEIWRR